jgi:hypothetical protein
MRSAHISLYLLPRPFYLPGNQRINAPTRQTKRQENENGKQERRPFFAPLIFASFNRPRCFIFHLPIKISHN